VQDDVVERFTDSRHDLRPEVRPRAIRPRVDQLASRRHGAKHEISML
jgi:hypothetical protein